MNEEEKGPGHISNLMREHVGLMSRVVPWGQAIGFRITRVEYGHVWGLQPWSEALVGDAATGIIHGGVITTFLDNLCGMACTAAMEELRFVATIDLRIDYMRPAEPGRDIIGEAQCYHRTRSVCFTRAWAYHESQDRLIATAAGTFAINKPRFPGSGTEQ